MEGLANSDLPLILVTLEVWAVVSSGASLPPGQQWPVAMTDELTARGRVMSRCPEVNKASTGHRIFLITLSLCRKQCGLT